MTMIIRNNKVYAGSGGGSGNANIVKVTQAEYDALPESKNSDGVLYAITDGESQSAGEDADMVIYTEEDGSKTTVQDKLSELNSNIDEQNKKIINVSNYNTLQEVFALVTSDTPILCYADWNSPIAQSIDSQNAFLFMTNWTCIAMTYKGDIYRANKENTTFYKANQGIVMTLDGTTLNIQTDNW